METKPSNRLPHRNDYANVVDLLRNRAARYPDRVAYRVLQDDGGIAEMTFAQFLDQSMRVATCLQQRASIGDRAIVLFATSLETITAFFGCICAGVIPIPVPMPRANQASSRLKSVIDDAAPVAVLAPKSVMAAASQRFSQNAELMATPWMAIEDAAASTKEGWRDPQATHETLAFLQYTSGSTAAPKGAMISHGNILANCQVIQELFGTSDQTNIVSWLPLFHDMGLVGMVINTAWTGGSCTLLAPATFMMRPLRWLEAVSKYRGTLCGAPDFAYELCVRKTTPEERAKLDLSSWETCFSGAEPVQARTIDRFCEAFAVSKLRREQFFPCYGLAEATLLVSTGPKLTVAEIVAFDSAGLEKGLGIDAKPGDDDVNVLVSNGWTATDHQMVIVDPETRNPCPSGVVGEIWLKGPSVAQGYWNRPDVTKEMFQATLADTGDGPFLRTGDLGFERKGALYIVGRLKDLIIIQGRNLYPSDLEISVLHTHQGFRPGGTAAFSVLDGGHEKLVIVQEVDRSFRKDDSDDAIVAIRQAIAAEHEVEVSTIVLLKPTSLPRTTSGKVQRGQCCQLFQKNELEVLCRWDLVERDDAEEALLEVPSGPRTAAEIRAWLVETLSERLGMRREHIDESVPFSALGLASKDAVALIGRLQKYLGRALSPALVYNHPTIDALSAHLAGAAPANAFPAPATPHAVPSTTPGTMPSTTSVDDITSLSEKDLEELVAREIAGLR